MAEVICETPTTAIGLATPHLVRMLFKREDFYFLFPRVALFGALVLLLCDFVARLPGTSTSLPLNTVTSILALLWLYFYC